MVEGGEDGEDEKETGMFWQVVVSSSDPVRPKKNGEKIFPRPESDSMRLQAHSSLLRSLPSLNNYPRDLRGLQLLTHSASFSDRRRCLIMTRTYSIRDLYPDPRLDPDNREIHTLLVLI